MKKRTSKTPSEQLQDELEPILQWEDEGGYHAILPKKKFLVINNNYQHHCVTPVTRDFRCTIQIWGKKIPPKI